MQYSLFCVFNFVGNFNVRDSCNCALFLFDFVAWHTSAFFFVGLMRHFVQCPLSSFGGIAAHCMAHSPRSTKFFFPFHLSILPMTPWFECEPHQQEARSCLCLFLTSSDNIENVSGDWPLIRVSLYSRGHPRQSMNLQSSPIYHTNLRQSIIFNLHQSMISPRAGLSVCSESESSRPEGYSSPRNI